MTKLETLIEEDRPEYEQALAEEAENQEPLTTTESSGDTSMYYKGDLWEKIDQWEKMSEEEKQAQKKDEIDDYDIH